MAFQRLVQKVQRHGVLPCSPSGHDSLRQLECEQERHFRWRFLSTGRPHIEQLAQRIFDDLKHELDGPELALAMDRLIESQQECWRLMCRHLEGQIHVALLRHHGGGDGKAGSPSLEKGLHDMTL
eukprot:CAMPEP_0180442716 /NCGR_PEP_ID=MMETSP1036_2-20121128/14286_1 /TAXON_ID=632150 /ORGANISM="Azadinium spinosum, Strain 3D9" /LENGTH=124 /DNA_ID=CAMNT_0022448973 /DNA_START=16 /DNA_END=387 /DNA_ORIENTATION=-